MVPIYRWSGEYVAFIRNDRLFSADSDYLGWVEEEDGSVWRADGKYLGEIVDENYILRKDSKMEPMAKMAKMTPMTPMTPMRRMNKMSRMAKMGWSDVFERLLPVDSE